MQVVASHHGPDFDALASMVVASKLYPEAALVITGVPEPSVQEFVTLHKGHFRFQKASEIPLEQVDTMVLVDVRNPSRLGPFRQLVQKTDLQLHIYDHHPATAESIQADLEVIKPYGAAVTVVLELLREKGLTLTTVEATLCLVALYEETGSLIFSSTTAQDLEAAAWLLRLGGNLKVVSRFAQYALSPSQKSLLDELLKVGRVEMVHGFQVFTAAIRCQRFVPGLAVLVHRLLEIQETDCALVAAEMGSKLCVVARSRRQDLDVGRVCEKLGGGGHPTAASATLDASDPEEMVQTLLELVGQIFPAVQTAAEIMTDQVRCLESESELSVEQASEQLRAWGHAGVCVTEQGVLVGILSRSDLDKALAHGLGHAPATAYMTSKVVSVNPSTPLPEIRSLMVERDIGRVPVLDGDKLVGLVSRTDVLAYLYRTPHERSTATVSVASRLLRLPEDTLAFLRHCSELVGRLDQPAFVVGGFVRDLLLGRANFDIDLVIEGDGPAFGRALAQETGGEVKVHARFQTCAVHYPEGDLSKVDVATARSETYCRPAALPAVEGSTLKQDLYRRDFTINCLAIHLDPDRFGELIDFFGGQRDLEAGLVRVLHNHSFIDDPTRAFRAVRFEQRLGFRLEHHTERLLRAAIKSRVLQELSPSRMLEELRLCLLEPHPIETLRRLEQLKILRWVDPGLGLDPKLTARLEAVPPILESFPVERWRLYLLLLLTRLKVSHRSQFAERYRVDIAPLERAARLVSKVSRPGLSDFELEHLLVPEEEEAKALACLLARDDTVTEAVLRFRSLQACPPLLRGRDLRALGLVQGPVYKEVLDQVRALQLGGELCSVQQARDWVTEHFLPLQVRSDSGENQPAT